MKKLLFLLMIIALSACAKEKKEPYTKPFIVIKKDYVWSSKNTDKTGLYYYVYQDVNGRIQGFKDLDKYSVGDTIK